MNFGEFCRNFLNNKGRLCFYLSNRTMDFVNSTRCIKSPPCAIITQEEFLYTKELLSRRIFLGYYRERRYVPELKDYRDVVCVSNDEIDLLCDIKKLRKKWSGVKNINWLGITDPDSISFPGAFCFWVKLKNLAFGHYWFQIKHVKLVEKEIYLQLKCIRKHRVPLVEVIPNILKEISERKNEKQETSGSVHASSNELLWNFNPKNAILSFQASCIKITSIVQPYITWKNFLYFIKMIIALMIVLVMGIISMIGHLGDYGLKLLRELTLLVNAFTPIAIQLIDFISKIIGGLYILIAGMFFRNAYGLNVRPNKNNTAYNIPYTKVTQRISSQVYPVDWRERNRILRQELLCNQVERN